MSGARVIPGGPDGPDPGEADPRDISMLVLAGPNIPVLLRLHDRDGVAGAWALKFWGPGNVQDWMIQAVSPPKPCPVIARHQDPQSHPVLMLQPHKPFQSRLCYLLPLRRTHRLIIKEKAYFFSMVICGNEACRKPHKICGFMSEAENWLT